MEPPRYLDYSPLRLVMYRFVTSKYFDLAISAVIGLNIITMAMEFYMMPEVGIIACQKSFPEIWKENNLYGWEFNTFREFTEKNEMLKIL